MGSPRLVALVAACAALVLVAAGSPPTYSLAGTSWTLPDPLSRGRALAHGFHTVKFGAELDACHLSFDEDGSSWTLELDDGSEMHGTYTLTGKRARLTPDSGSKQVVIQRYEDDLNNLVLPYSEYPEAQVDLDELVTYRLWFDLKPKQGDGSVVGVMRWKAKIRGTAFGEGHSVKCTVKGRVRDTSVEEDLGDVED